MPDLATLFADIVGPTHLLTGDAISDDYGHDEALTIPPQRPPAYLAKPASAEEVAALLKTATEHRVPVTARGSGCGLSGAAQPVADGVLISFERMNAILEIDTDNHVAVVQPGVTLTELDAETARVGLSYTVYPRRAVLQRRRQRRDQRRRHAGREVRRHPPQRARPAGRPAHRRDHPHRRQDVEDLHRIRPHPADHRLRGHARLGDRGHRQTGTPVGAQRDRAGSVRRLRPGHGRRAEAHLERTEPHDRRVHRQHRDGRDRQRRETGTGHPRADPRHVCGLPGRRSGEQPHRSSRRGRRDAGRAAQRLGARWMPMCYRAIRLAD